MKRLAKKNTYKADISMRLKYKLTTVVAALIIALMVASCGKKGPLTLPSAFNANVHSVSVVVSPPLA